MKFDQKNDWAIDLHLHIPIPSISISISGGSKSEVDNEPLTFSASVEESETVHEDRKPAGS